MGETVTAGDPALLAQLRDIHATAAPGPWPPAVGWWLLALLLAVCLGVLGRLLLRRIGVARRRRRWLQALDEISRQHDPAHAPRDFQAGINRLFRAVALRAFPGSGCARLQGAEWVAFIRAHLPAERHAELAALAHGPYEPAPRFDAEGMREAARAWVQQYG